MTVVLITGGARSGKSAAAQELAARVALDGREVAVVVFGRDDDADPEFSARVARHRAERPAGWQTIEAANDPDWLSRIEPGRVVLLDCLGTMLGLVMEQAYACCGDTLADADPHVLPEGLDASVTEGFSAAIDELLGSGHDLIVVTNEVGSGLVPGWASERLFRDVLGLANRRVARIADAAYLCVCGRLVDLGSLPQTATWPHD